MTRLVITGVEIVPRVDPDRVPTLGRELFRGAVNDSGLPHLGTSSERNCDPVLSQVFDRVAIGLPLYDPEALGSLIVSNAGLVGPDASPLEPFEDGGDVDPFLALDRFGGDRIARRRGATVEGDDAPTSVEDRRSRRPSLHRDNVSNSASG